MIQILVKIVITLFIIGVAGFALKKTWTSDIDITRFLSKPSEIIPVKAPEPVLDYSMMLQQLRYEPGLEVKGLIWKENYREYLLKISHKKKSADIHDIRMVFNMPGEIMQYSVVKQVGCSGINFSMPDSIIGKGSKETKTIKELVDT